MSTQSMYMSIGAIEPVIDLHRVSTIGFKILRIEYVNKPNILGVLLWDYDCNQELQILHWIRPDLLKQPLLDWQLWW
jgi:hypothetical protein